MTETVAMPMAGRPVSLSPAAEPLILRRDSKPCTPLANVTKFDGAKVCATAGKAVPGQSLIQVVDVSDDDGDDALCGKRSDASYSSSETESVSVEEMFSATERASRLADMTERYKESCAVRTGLEHVHGKFFIGKGSNEKKAAEDKFMLMRLKLEQAKKKFADSKGPKLACPERKLDLSRKAAGPPAIRELRKSVTAVDRVISRKPGTLEVFCGSAGLTEKLRTKGFNAVGIDHARNKDKPKSKCVNINMETPEGQAAFWTMVEANEVVFVHFSPPCGTSTRAREVRRFNKDGTPAERDPKPLRNDEFPDGIASLKGADASRVAEANALYKFTAEAAVALDKKGISWSIENPKNSLMWLTTWFCEASSVLGARRKESNFQMCMHGGRRDKHTKMWYGGKLNLECLSVLCDKRHDHLPWGVVKDQKGQPWATDGERRFPDLLCQRIAAQVAKKHGVKPPADATIPDKVFLGSQPRRGTQDIIPEYKELLS